jgi:hypothetical protein
MGGSGGPNPKGKQIPSATVTEIDLENGKVTFQMPMEDVSYFKKDNSYKLIAIDK